MIYTHWLSFFLWLGVAGRSCSNFLASAVAGHSSVVAFEVACGLLGMKALFVELNEKLECKSTWHWKKAPHETTDYPLFLGPV